ncbi:hypothetical protein HanIR_Chr14g0700161 [Helianthus annuus]|nr:hypothetical protein HanIR_Chr14g0700161 [Helianthus annuus]
MRVQNRFHLHTTQILSTTNNHVFRSVLDLQIPVRVHYRHVTSIKPPVFPHAFRGLFWIFKITQHNTPTA